jgi:hypothetical protein
LKAVAPPIVLLVAALGTSRPAHACSPSLCFPPTSLLPSGTVPANLGALASTVEDVELVRELDDGWEDVPLKTIFDDESAAYLFMPLAPLSPGARYRLVPKQPCVEQGVGLLEVSFETVEARDIPPTLGSTVVMQDNFVAPLSVKTDAGSCDVEIDAAQVLVALDFSDEAELWKDAFLYETYVDGERWRPSASLLTPPSVGASWIGRGIDALFARCAGDESVDEPGLAEGTHAVTFHALLPALGVAIEAKPAMVTLSCSDSDSDSDSGSDSASGRDGCGCRLSERPAPGAWLAFIAIACGALIRFRAGD